MEKKLTVEEKYKVFGFIIGFLLPIIPLVGQFNLPRSIEAIISFAWFPLCPFFPEGHPNLCHITIFLMPFIYGFIGVFIGRFIFYILNRK